MNKEMRTQDELKNFLKNLPIRKEMTTLPAFLRKAQSKNINYPYTENMGVYEMEDDTYLMIYNASSLGKILPSYRVVDKKGKRLINTFDKVKPILDFYKKSLGEKGEKVMKKNIIENQKEVKSGNVILEKVDKKRILHGAYSYYMKDVESIVNTFNTPWAKEISRLGIDTVAPVIEEIIYVANNNNWDKEEFKSEVIKILGL
jgi:NADH/NAD ratio-sensing transcriptional regulator Rex